MKKMFLAFFMLSSFCMIAQQRSNENSPLAGLRSEKDPAVLKEKIKALENGTPGDLMVLVQYYGRDSVKKSAIRKMLNKKYPQSEEAFMSRMLSFNDVKGGNGSPEEVENHYKLLRKEHPNANMDREKNMVAMAYAEAPDVEKVMEYINSMEDPVYKVAAISMNVDLIDPVNQKMALDMATKGLERAKKLTGQTAHSKTLKLDPKAVYNEYITIYGKLLFKAGKNKEAYQYIKEAYQKSARRDEELTENYAFLSSLFDANYEEALPVLAKAIQGGQFELSYIEQVRKGYQKLNPGKDADAYISTLKKEFIDKIRTHAEKLMVNEVAPNFTITDVDGKKVTLADFKGKTIVLDFWATWCGPCVASFPAMQMAANRFKNDPNVKFLFIHCWEHVDDPLTDAKQFLDKRGYDFDLYMDFVNKETKRSPASDAFNIKGIPAKFIIDGNGRIRFKVAGFSGSQEAAAEEVVQMVELTRKAA